MAYTFQFPSIFQLTSETAQVWFREDSIALLRRKMSLQTEYQENKRVHQKTPVTTHV